VALHDLSQVGLFHAGHDVRGGDIAHQPVDAAVGGDQHLAAGQQFHQRAFVVRLVFSLLPPRVKPCIWQECRGIDLEFVGPQRRVVPQPSKILQIALRRGTQQVGHPVGDDLETGQPQQSHRLARVGDGVAALIEGQQAIIQALHPQLHLGRAQPAQPLYLLDRDAVGPRLHHQPDVAVRAALVDPLGFLQCGGFDLVQRVEAAAHEPLLVRFRVTRPRPAQDE